MSENETPVAPTDDSTTEDAADQQVPIPPASFEYLVATFRFQTEMQLGLLHFGEEKDRPKPNLDLARHFIDMLAMLQDKTRGNLSLEEQRMLDNSVTELRFRFVQTAGKISPGMSGGPAFKITVLGSGTSVGVPTVGCHCAVCNSADPRDKRLRPSILLTYEGHNVVIDTTPDFRTQILRANVDHLDAVIYTHSHADHIMGLDDVRPFNFRQGQHIPIYASPNALDVIRRVFAYVFDETSRNTHIPRLELHELDGSPFDVLGARFIPVPIQHGNAGILGFRFGNAAYLTDHSAIPESSMELLQGLDVLFLDALRHKPHPTHSTVQQSIETASALQPRRTFFTHICHDLPHVKTELALPPNVFLAFDGLEIEVPAA